MCFRPQEKPDGADCRAEHNGHPSKRSPEAESTFAQRRCRTGVAARPEKAARPLDVLLREDASAYEPSAYGVRRAEEPARRFVPALSREPPMSDTSHVDATKFPAPDQDPSGNSK